MAQPPLVRIPNNDDEWEQHVHMSGRHFLRNRGTNETRWLWTKWDINGRLFVRNTVDPNHRVWLDEMAFDLRIQSGTATPDEVKQYVAAPAAPAPPAVPQSQLHRLQLHAQQPHVPYANHHTFPNATHAPLHDPYAGAPFQHAAHPHPLPHHPRSHNPALSALRSQLPADPYNATLRAPPHVNPSALPSLSPHTDNRRPSNLDFPSQPQPHLQPHPYNHPNHISNPRIIDPHSHPARTAAPPPRTAAPPPHPAHDLSARSLACESSPKGVKRAAQHFQPSPYPVRYFHSQEKQHALQPNGRSPSLTAKRRRFHDAAQAPHLAPIAQRRLQPILPLPPLSSSRVLPKAARRLRLAFTEADARIVESVHERQFAGTSTTDTANGGAAWAGGLDMAEDGMFAVEQPVVGTSEDIEKDFLRLTSAPKPELVRPPLVLRTSLAHIKERWKTGERGYDWVCRQLKSVRQDYTVQAVTDADVADVYETHARIALENNDMGEFNTCVARVRQLYGKVERAADVQDEFAAYRILYNVVMGAKPWELQRMLCELTPEERERDATRFALRARFAAATGDYHGFFQMAKQPPQGSMIGYLLRHLEPRVRHRALSAMVAAYGPGQPGTLPVRFVARELGWYDNMQNGVEEAPVLAEKMLEGVDILQKVREIGLVRERPWVWKMVDFLLGVGIVLVGDAAKDVSERIDALVVDCKGTKAGGGVKALKGGGKVITHAGASW